MYRDFEKMSEVKRLEKRRLILLVKKVRKYMDR